MDGENVSGTPKKRKRHRMYVRNLLQQFECQFVNCFRDTAADLRWLKQEIESNAEGWVQLGNLLLKNGVQRSDLNLLLLKTLSDETKFLQVNNDCTSIRLNRTNRFQIIEDCTIFIDKIPKDADNDWIRSVFSRFGFIADVRIPKPKTSSVRKNRGFAFVCFSNPTSAQNALTKFKQEQSKNVKKHSSGKRTPVKNNNRRETITVVVDDEPPAKKIRLDDQQQPQSQIAQQKPKNKPRKQNKNRKLRYRKNNEQFKQKMKDLNVYSLAEWSKLKVDYLALQKRNHAALKVELKSRKIPTNDNDRNDLNSKRKRKRGREKLADRATAALEVSLNQHKNE